MTIKTAIIFLTSTLLCLAPALSPHAEEPTLRLLGTIPLAGVRGRIDHMAATPDGHTLFVAALGSNRVLRIDTQESKVNGVIRRIRAPQGVAYLPKSGKLAVASGGGNDLQFYTDTLRPAGIVRGLDDADNVRYDADANLLYAGYGQGALGIIDPQMIVQTGRIPLDGHPESFQLEQRGTRIFINVPTANEIEVFDRATRRLLNEWKIADGTGNFPMALDEAHKRLFIGTRNPPGMLVFETEAGKEVAVLSACGDTDDLFYDTLSRLIFLSGGQGCVDVFHQSDAVGYARLDSVNTMAGARTSLLVPAAHRFYVAAPRRGRQRAQILVFATP